MDTKTKIFYYISVIINIFQIYYAIWLINSQIVNGETYFGIELMSDALLYLSIAFPFIVLIVNIIVLIKDKTVNKKLILFNYVCVLLEPCKEFQYVAFMQGIMTIFDKLIFDRF